MKVILARLRLFTNWCAYSSGVLRGKPVSCLCFVELHLCPLAKALSRGGTWCYPGNIMALQRQIRRTGRSLAITIPKDLVDLYEVGDGNQADFEPLGERTFRIKLVRKGTA